MNDIEIVQVARLAGKEAEDRKKLEQFNFNRESKNGTFFKRLDLRQDKRKTCFGKSEV
jgi:hypothetical protein